MSGLPWWLQAYILVAAASFGWLLAEPQSAAKKLSPVVNLIWSAILAAVWPVTAILVAGAMIADETKGDKK